MAAGGLSQPSQVAPGGQSHGATVHPNNTSLTPVNYLETCRKIVLQLSCFQVLQYFDTWGVITAIIDCIMTLN
jgi:hypothetical protein